MQPCEIYKCCEGLNLPEHFNKSRASQISAYVILVVASDHFFKHTLPFSICSFFFFFHRAQKTLFIHTAPEKGRLTSIWYPLGLPPAPARCASAHPLLLLGCKPPLLFCPRFQVIVALGPVGHAEEQGGVTAELVELRDLYRRNHLVRDPRTGSTIRTEEDAARP